MHDIRAAKAAVRRSPGDGGEAGMAGFPLNGGEQHGLAMVGTSVVFVCVAQGGRVIGCPFKLVF